MLVNQIPDRIRQVTKIDDVLERIGGFELDYEDDGEEDDDDDEARLGDLTDEADDQEESSYAEEQQRPVEIEIEDEEEIDATPEQAVPLAGSSDRTRHFLVVLKFMEQLTKATMALEEIVLLAKRLNRTLVLPRVGSSYAA